MATVGPRRTRYNPPAMDPRVVASDLHACPHCGRAIPLDQRTAICRGCGGDLTPVLGRRGAENVGCLTNFGFGVASAFAGGVIAVTSFAVDRQAPLWRLEERDLATMMALGLGGALLGAICGATVGLWLPFDRRRTFEGVLIFVTSAALALLVAVLMGLPPKTAAAVGLPVGIAFAWVFWLGVEKQRTRDVAELRSPPQQPPARREETDG